MSSTGETAVHRLALQVEDLHVSYGPKLAVDGVSLEINGGEIFGLLGPNGAGRASTLSAIEGLLRPDSGSIRIGDVDARANPIAAKARMGVQLQSTSFQSDLRIREIVRLYAGLYGVLLTRAGIDDLLADVHLEEEASKRFSQLSGGQQKRVSLVIATIHDPPLVLLDEPTAGLDPQARRQLWDRIERLRDAGRRLRSAELSTAVRPRPFWSLHDFWNHVRDHRAVVTGRSGGDVTRWCDAAGRLER